MIARYYNVDGSKIACNLLGGTDMIHPETFKFLDSSTLYRRVETKEAGMEKCRQCAFQHERMLCNAAPRCGPDSQVNDMIHKNVLGRTPNTYCHFKKADYSITKYDAPTVETLHNV